MSRRRLYFRFYLYISPTGLNVSRVLLRAARLFFVLIVVKCRANPLGWCE